MEGINTGLSVKERMKLFMNQKPTDEAKSKSEISTGVSIRDRQASFQAKPQADNSAAKFVPSSSQPKTANTEPVKVTTQQQVSYSTPKINIAPSPQPVLVHKPKEEIIQTSKPTQIPESKPVIISNPTVANNIPNSEPKTTSQAKPAEVVSTGMSIKERMAAFQNASKPKTDYKPSSSTTEKEAIIAGVSVKDKISSAFVQPKPEKEPVITGVSVKDRVSSTFIQSKPEKEPIFTGVSVKDRVSSTFVSQNPEKEEVNPDSPIKERISLVFSAAPLVSKPQEKEEIFTGPSIKERMSLTFSSAPALSTPYKEKEPFSFASDIEEPTKAPISTGVSIKERMAALQQAAKGPSERTSIGYVPGGPSIKERISLVQESSTHHHHHHAHKAKTEEVFSSDVKSRTSKFENPEHEEVPRQRESITTGRTAGQNEEFKKRMEGMVFMPPPVGAFAAKPAPREYEPVKEHNGNVVLVELEKPVRKRAAATYEDDFDF